MCDTTDNLKGSNMGMTKELKDLTDRTPSTSLERLALFILNIYHSGTYEQCVLLNIAPEYLVTKLR